MSGLLLGLLGAPRLLATRIGAGLSTLGARDLVLDLLREVVEFALGEAE